MFTLQSLFPHNSLAFSRCVNFLQWIYAYRTRLLAISCSTFVKVVVDQFLAKMS